MVNRAQTTSYKRETNLENMDWRVHPGPIMSLSWHCTRLCSTKKSWLFLGWLLRLLVKIGERWDIAGRGGEWRILICLSFQVLNHYNSICINDRTKRNPNSMFIMQRWRNKLLNLLHKQIRKEDQKENRVFVARTQQDAQGMQRATLLSTISHICWECTESMSQEKNAEMDYITRERRKER